jgi:phosphoribosylformylglycinamidine cyclo-ligase
MGRALKGILAYLYWKETGDVSVWKGDCAGCNCYEPGRLALRLAYMIIFSFLRQLTGIKEKFLPRVWKPLSTAHRSFSILMKEYGVNIHFMGGETADVGDLVRTMAVNGTITARWPKNKIITNEKIVPGNVIVGLSGFGRADYESEYNSGLASNGLTSARHDVLQKLYGTNFPESI